MSCTDNTLVPLARVAKRYGVSREEILRDLRHGSRGTIAAWEYALKAERDKAQT